MTKRKFTVYDIEREMVKCENMLDDAIKAVLVDYTNYELIVVMEGNTGSWSGGPSVKNLVEDRWRRVATKMLRARTPRLG